MNRAHVVFAPVGGPVLTRPVKWLAALFAVGGAIVLYRFVFGIGSVSALNDAYTWGTWKALSVIVFTAFASGGYAVALLVYVLNRRTYHALARTALLTSALGYTAAIVTLGIDIGRPWNFWRLIFVTGWNLHSVLLEIAVCLSTYLIFLWLEMAPPFLETWSHGDAGPLRRLARWATPLLDRVLPWIVAMAIVLPSMHQSSLGSLMLLAGPRLHPYWQTPMLPLLFLISCWLLGYAFVIMTMLLSSLAWGRRIDMEPLASLARISAWVAFAFLAVRAGDLLARGQFVVVPLTGYSLLVLIESGLLLWAGLIMQRCDRSTPPQMLFLSACAALVGGGLYRLDAALIALMPGTQFSYFPSVPETLVTLGFTSLAVLGFIVIVKRFPILAQETR
jgi:Ni/Fe-hydrogenase subunit HybB-like protein